MNEITKKLTMLLAIGLFLFLQLVVQAQTKQSQEFLIKMGLKDSIYSKILDEQRTIYVQLPASYTPEKNIKYPVAYLLDGEVFLPTVANVQSYYSGGFTPEMVLVGISNAKNRTRDLTISKIKERLGRPFNAENGGADQFSDFIEKELIPFVERKYPVTNYRTLIGHSHGGLFTIHTLLTKPTLFTNYLAIDPSLDWDNQKLIHDAKAKLSKGSYVGKSLFLSLGGQLHMQNTDITITNVRQDTSVFTEFARANLAFSDVVNERKESGLAFHWKFYPNDLHGTIPLPSIMDGLIAIFGWYQMENTHKINDFDTPTSTLYTIVKHREQKLKTHFGYIVPPYPNELFNVLGYMSMEKGKTEKAKMYFEFAIEYYPKNANVYDSMADYYEAQGDLSNALKFVRKAVELSDNVYYKDRLHALQNK